MSQFVVGETPEELETLVRFLGLNPENLTTISVERRINYEKWTNIPIEDEVSITIVVRRANKALLMEMDE